MANLIKILLGTKANSECCSIEIKEVAETEEQNASCCNGNTSCC